MMHSSISAAACVSVLLLPILHLLVVLCFHCYYLSVPVGSVLPLQLLLVPCVFVPFMYICVTCVV